MAKKEGDNSLVAIKPLAERIRMGLEKVTSEVFGED